MSKRSIARASKGQLEALEPRRLLSLGVIGSDIAGGEADSKVGTDVAVAPGGQYIVATGVRVDASLDVTAQRCTAAGAPLGAKLSLFSGARVDPSTSQRVSTATDADGDSVVAYTVKRWTGNTDRNTFNSSLFVNRISRTGATGTPILVQSYDSASGGAVISDVTVTMSDDGGFFVGWVTTTGKERSRATMRAYAASGRPRAAAFDVVREDAGRAAFSRFELSARPDGAGTVYAVGERSGGGTVNVIRYGRTSASHDLDGRRPFTITTLHGASHPSISMFPDASYVISFTDGLYFDRTDKVASYVQSFTPLGGRKDYAAQLGVLLPDRGGGVHNTEVTAIRDGDNGFVVAYTLSDRESEITGDWGYVEQLTAHGSFRSGPVLIDTESGSHDYFGTDPRIGLTADTSGHVVTSFTSGLVDEGTTDEWANHTRLTTAPAALAGSELRVFGELRDETITVQRDGANVTATVDDGDPLAFDASLVQTLTIDGNLGDDRIINNTALPATIHGGSGADRIDGGSANDEIHGDDGADDLSGNDGNDALYGDAGNDILVGNNGNDSLYGGAGRDRVYGYAGNDQLFAKDGEIDQLFGNGGRNTFSRDDGDIVN